MGIGLAGAYGTQGAYQSLDQLLAQRTAAQMYADKMRQQQFENQRQLVGDSRAQQQLDATLDNTRAARERQGIEDTIKQGNTMNEAIPGGTTLPMNDPRLGALRSAGAQLTHQDATLPSTQFGGASTLPGATKPSGFLRTNINAGNPEQYIKGATEKQANYAAGLADKQADNERQVARDADLQRHERVMENKPTAPTLMTVQTVDETGQPVTRIVPKVAGASYAKGPSATTQNRLDSARAVTQTGNDIIAQLSDPKFKAVVGPELGRYSTLRDFIGNPPPEYAKLAGQVESYALANMGVHGMRSAQGAEQIKHLLDQKHTPESLVAAIQGLNGFSEHFLENAGRGKKTDGGNGAGVIYARDPQGQLHQAKAGTALPAGWKEEKR